MALTGLHREDKLERKLYYWLGDVSINHRSWYKVIINEGRQKER